MMWAIKHKSGRVLFVTDSKVTADNREKMGWIVDKIISKCPKCNDTGMADSGGVQPWGESILIECDCKVVEVKMTSREQFEAWCKERAIRDDYQYMDGLFSRPRGGDHYSVTWVAMDWEVWQASRAAIEINLPSRVGAKSSWQDGPHMFADEVIEAVESQGLKVKK